MQPDALLIEDLDSHYGDSHVLQRVSLRVPQGALVALLGRNAAGKSTLLHTIVGFQPVTRGRISCFGTEVVGRAPEDIAGTGVALVPQGRRIFKSLSVRENIDVARRRGSTFDVEKLYSWFPVLKRRHKQLAGSLSGGEQQMLAIARALAGGPRLVLLDEPSEGLAPQIVEDVAEILQRLRAEGLSLLLVEQNLRFALKLADHIVLLNTGNVVFSGTNAEAQKTPDILHQHLGLH